MIEDFDGATEEDLKGGNVNAPGYFHVYIAAEARNEKNDATKVDFEVLAGTAKGQDGKKAVHFFQDPSPSHKDQGKFCRAMKTRLYLATGLMHAGQIGQKVRIDSAQLVGKQAIVKLKINEKGFAEIDGQEIYAVLDPAMGHVPKNAQALTLLQQAAPIQQQVAPVNQAPPAAAPAAAAAPAQSAPQAAASAPAADNPWDALA